MTSNQQEKVNWKSCNDVNTENVLARYDQACQEASHWWNEYLTTTDDEASERYDGWQHRHMDYAMVLGELLGFPRDYTYDKCMERRSQ